MPLLMHTDRARLISKLLVPQQRLSLSSQCISLELKIRLGLIPAFHKPVWSAWGMHVLEWEHAWEAWIAWMHCTQLESQSMQDKSEQKNSTSVPSLHSVTVRE